MRNVQGIAFIWTQTYKEISKSSVTLNTNFANCAKISVWKELSSEINNGSYKSTAVTINALIS